MSFREFSKERPFRDLALQARNCGYISAFGNYGYGTIRVSSMTRTSNVVSVVLQDAPGDAPGDFTIVDGMSLVLTCAMDTSFSVDGATITLGVDQLHFTYPSVGADGALNIGHYNDVVGAILGAVPLGANGWPKADHRMILSSPAGGSETSNPEVAGVYTCTFLGSVPTGLAQENCTISGQAGNSFTLTISAADTANNVAIRFTGVATDGSYAGLTIVPQGSSATVLRPAYKTAMQRYGGHRWMDAMLTNGNPAIVSWTNRPRAPVGLGFPVEKIVAAHNELGGYCWLNIPLCASDAYVTGMANYVRDNLNVSLEAIFEYSNELWNFGGSFPQYGWVRGFAKADLAAVFHGKYGWNEISSLSRTGGVATVVMTHNLPASYVTGLHIDAEMSDANFSARNVPITKTAANTFTYPVGAGTGAASTKDGVIYGNLASNLLNDTQRDVGFIMHRWIARRVYQIAQLISTSFGGLGSRAKVAYMGQLSNQASYQQAVEWLEATYGSVPFQAFGGAPYSYGVGANAAAILSYLQTNTDISGNSIFSQFHGWRYLATRYGAKLWCYEGGPDLGAQNAATTDSVYSNTGFNAATKACIDAAFAGGADRMMFFGTGLRWLTLAGSATWGIAENIGIVGAYGSSTSNKQKGIDAALGAAPATIADTSRFPGTVTLAVAGVDAYDGRVGGQMVNGVQCMQTANDYFEKLFYVPAAGTFNLTFWGKYYNQFGTSNNNLRVFIGTSAATMALAGTIALFSDGFDVNAGGTPQGGYASPTSMPVTLAKGWYIIRCQGPSGGQPDRIGVSKIVGV